MPKKILAAPIKAIIEPAITPNLSFPKDMCGVTILTKASKINRKVAAVMRQNRNDFRCADVSMTLTRVTIRQIAGIEGRM